MLIRPNLFHLIAFDPGGTIGWAHLTIDFKAFSRPEHKALKFVKEWDCGEYQGTEFEQIKSAVLLCTTAKFGRYKGLPFVSKMDVLTEDFDLVQTVGGKELVSPIRINAVLDFELMACLGQPLNYQKRQARTQITTDRLRAFGFDGKWTTKGRGKDAFAAMQHAVVWLRRLKARADRIPWMLEDGTSTNAYWDCACASGSIRHDLVHPS